MPRRSARGFARGRLQQRGLILAEGALISPDHLGIASRPSRDATIPPVTAPKDDAATNRAEGGRACSQVPEPSAPALALDRRDACRVRYSRMTARGRDVRLLALTWAAGSIDAISYLGLGHVFTAMMTGNTALLGLALAQGEARAVLRSTVALLAFATGAAVGALIVERDDGREEWPAAVTRALTLESAVLFVFSVAWVLTGPARGERAVFALIALSGLAMGIQAAAVRRLGVPGIATTYITGTLTSLMADLVGWLRVGARTGGREIEPAMRWERRVGLLAAVFFVYGLGAFVGATLHAGVSSLVTLLPLLAVTAVVVGRRSSVSQLPRP